MHGPHVSGRGLTAARLLHGFAGAWAEANGLVIALPLAGTLLDSRHSSSDGRLAYQTPAQARQALLERIPEKVTAPDGDLLDALETLRTLLRYLDAHGLRDPRGAAIEENESAIDTAAKQFADAIGDQDRYGMAKTVVLFARDRGVDIGDPAALRPLYDVIVPDVLAAIYSMDEPVPVARLAAAIWDTVQAHFHVDALSPLAQTGLRGRVGNDLEHIFDAF